MLTCNMLITNVSMTFLYVIFCILTIVTWIISVSVFQIKTDLETNLNLTKTELGWLDTALLFPYAVMQVNHLFSVYR